MTRLFVVFLAVVGASGAAAREGPTGDILYYEETGRGRGNLVLLNLETGDKRQVGKSGTRSDHFPSWSPDGRRFVFESYRKGGWHVWVSDADGSGARRLSDFPDHRTSKYEFDPTFAADNRTVVFVHDDSLWTVTLDDPTPRPLTPAGSGTFQTAPAWSPTGERIAIAGRDAARDWNIYTLNHNGSDFQQLTRDGLSFAPEWSPDGRHILFYSNRGGSFELYEMALDGSNVQPILDRGQLERAGFDETTLIDPWDGDWGATEQFRASYSPDGKWIAFSRDLDGDRELFVCRLDGSGIIRVTRRAGLDAQPAWRPR